MESTEVKRRCTCKSSGVFCEHGNSYAVFCEGCYAKGRAGETAVLVSCECGYWNGRDRSQANPKTEAAPSQKLSLPTDSKARKNVPMATGVLDYFPAALAAIAALSKAGNDKHNPGQPLHWARGKSMDHADCIMRHLTDRGTVDPEDNIRHSVKVAWRALALLQEELEKEEGAPLPRAAW